MPYDAFWKLKQAALLTNSSLFIRFPSRFFLCASGGAAKKFEPVRVSCRLVYHSAKRRFIQQSVEMTQFFLLCALRACFKDSVEGRLGYSPELFEAPLEGYFLQFRITCLSTHCEPYFLR